MSVPGHHSHSLGLAGLAEVRLAAIVEATDDAIVTTAIDGTIVTWNPAASRIFGYSAAEMIGASIAVLIPPELQDAESDLLARAGAGESIPCYETTRQHHDGHTIPIELTLWPLRDERGTVVGISSIGRDISERKRADDALRQTAKLEAIGRLAGGLAHDFNNQLHALTGFANFIGRDPNLSGAARHDLHEIQKATEQMASLTRQLLAFARQEALNPETLDLNATVTDMEPMLRRLIGSHMEMRFELTHGPQWVRADRAQLAQVVMNLVINARDAMPNGGALLVATAILEIGADQLTNRLGRPVAPGAYAELAVSDRGCGVAPDALSRIFDPFYTTKDTGHGTGLGLATVDSIVAQSAGHIQVESAMGHGTTIKILLPIVESLSPVALLRSRRRRSTATAGRHLLVVDDEAMVRTIIVRTLEAEGYQVLSAGNGQDALDCLEQMDGKADLMITDIIMPVMGGRELVAEATRRHPSLPVIWMSGNARESEFPEHELEGRPFLQKPVRTDILLSTVATALSKASNRSR